MKAFRQEPQIGRVKYPISFHDGITKNNDGSDFWGIACFNNKKKAQAYVKKLKANGYKEA